MKRWILNFLLLFMFILGGVRCFRGPSRATRVFIIKCSSRSIRSAGANSNSNKGKHEPVKAKEEEEFEYHIPVMRDECCEYLLSGSVQEKGVFIDCTVGGGGHTKEILKKGGKVIAFDQDPDALAETSRKLSTYIEDGRLELVHTNFRNIANAVSESKLAKENGGLCDGVLMDLGISSHQINVPGRGFAFAADGPLDMRMGRNNVTCDDPKDEQMLSSSSSSLTAAMVCNDFQQDDIANILYNYGEETRSRKLAREIVAARPISTTKELVDVISRVTPFKERTKILARCFQALRIAVNDEMGALDKALQDVYTVIRPGGRLVVLSYHSLEDRRVKTLIKTGKPNLDYSDNDTPRGLNSYSSPWNAIFKKAQIPNPSEIERNSRARSAKLRVAERISFGEDELAQEYVFLGSTNFEKKNKYKVGVIGKKERKKAAARETAESVEDEL